MVSFENLKRGGLYWIYSITFGQHEEYLTFYQVEIKKISAQGLIEILRADEQITHKNNNSNFFETYEDAVAHYMQKKITESIEIFKRSGVCAFFDPALIDHEE